MKKRIKTEWLSHCHFVHGLTFEEISALTGMSRAGIFKRLKKTGSPIGQEEPAQAAPDARTDTKAPPQGNAAAVAGLGIGGARLEDELKKKMEGEKRPGAKIDPEGSPRAKPGPVAPGMVTRLARILAQPSHSNVSGPSGPDDINRIRMERLLSFRDEKKRGLT